MPTQWPELLLSGCAELTDAAWLASTVSAVFAPADGACNWTAAKPAANSVRTTSAVLIDRLGAANRYRIAAPITGAVAYRPKLRSGLSHAAPARRRIGLPAARAAQPASPSSPSNTGADRQFVRLRCQGLPRLSPSRQEHGDNAAGIQRRRLSEFSVLANANLARPRT